MRVTRNTRLNEDESPGLSSVGATALEPPTSGVTGRNIDSASPTEGIDLAQLRFVRFLVRYGATLDEAALLMDAELERARKASEKKRRQMLRRSQLQQAEVQA